MYVLLLNAQIGPSAIVGFSLFILLAPLQTYFMKTSFIVRKKSMVGVSKLLSINPAGVDRRKIKAAPGAPLVDADHQGVHVRDPLLEA